MSGRSYVKGRRFEYSVMAFFRKRGYYCIRSYGSKGLYDLICIPPSTNKSLPLMVQAKYNGYVPKEERERLKENAEKWYGLPIIAWTKNRKKYFKTLDGKDITNIF